MNTLCAVLFAAAALAVLVPICRADPEFDTIMRKAAEIGRATAKLQAERRVGRPIDFGVADSGGFTCIAAPGTGLARLAVDIAQVEWGGSSSGYVAHIRLIEADDENVDLWTVPSLRGAHRLWIYGPRDRLPEMVRDAVRSLKERTVTKRE